MRGTVVIQALNTEPTAGLIPFSDLKSLTSKYVCEVWQRKWDEAGLISDKLHETLPRLSGKLLNRFVTQERKTLF